MEKNGVAFRPPLPRLPRSTVLRNAQVSESRLHELEESYATLQERCVELIDYLWVLRECGGFFDCAPHQADYIRRNTMDEAPLLGDIEPSVLQRGARRCELSDLQKGPMYGEPRAVRVASIRTSISALSDSCIFKKPPRRAFSTANSRTFSIAVRL